MPVIKTCIHACIHACKDTIQNIVKNSLAEAERVQRRLTLFFLFTGGIVSPFIIKEVSMLRCVLCSSSMAMQVLYVQYSSQISFQCPPCTSDAECQACPAGGPNTVCLGKGCRVRYA